ncbi:hypothetical protein [Legionella genomosp. 1]|uniref:hypothetical protein n=1 Tax=Legionella genomosp. 1 TaxID=1093625 RepID=UPI001055D46D|nr:hypothetical protein [Legionella genomosp. 1]
MPCKTTELINKINQEALQALSNLQTGPHRKNVDFFEKLKGNYQPFSSKQIVEVLKFRHDFSDKEHPELFLIEFIISLGAYAVYLSKRKQEASKDMFKHIFSDIFNLKIMEINLSLKDLLLNMADSYKNYAFRLINQGAESIEKYRKRDRFINSSEMLEMHSAIVGLFVSVELREEFTFIPRSERHKNKEIVTINHLEDCVRALVRDRYEKHSADLRLL